MDNTEKINSLLTLAQRGYKLIPIHKAVDGKCSCGNPACSSMGKHPRISKWPEQASADEEQIKNWHESWPESNWGAATGRKSGFVALDVDGPAGDNSLAELEALHGKLPQTLTSKTGKGWHYLFAAPQGPLGNSVGMKPGLDVRADGGYIVIPPSAHASGNSYRWLDETAEINDLPSWLESLMRQRKPSTRLQEAKQTTSLTQNEILHKRFCEYGRNNYLHSEAGRLRSLGYEPEAILPLILELNQRKCAPPLDEDEVASLVNSTWRYDPDEFRGIHFTDAGNAELMARKYRGQVLYCPDVNSYLVYDGSRYVKDENSRVEWMMKCTLKEWMTKANQDSDEDRRKRTIQHILKSENQNRIKAAADSLKSEPNISVKLETFDTDIWKFNVANGTLNLKTGILLPHRSEDLLMKKSPVKFDPDAKCPNWVSFMDSITNGDKELQLFLQEALGYSLTGATKEQCIFIMHGNGANGKSTFVEIAREVLGDYGMQIPVETLLVRKHEGASNDVAALKGARFAAASEAEKGQSLAESKIKQLVAGNDKISARFLYGEFFEYVPQFKIFLATNWMPRISGTDQGIWRRIRLIPFAVEFLDPKLHPDAPDNRKQDRALGDKLRAELSGILNWMIEGCLRWQQGGLSRPAVVTAATESYRDDNDPVGQFIGDCCTIKDRCNASFASIYESYYQWAEVNHERAISRKEFSQRLGAKGYARERKGKSGEMHVVGLELVRVPGIDHSSMAEAIKIETVRQSEAASGL